MPSTKATRSAISTTLAAIDARTPSPASGPIYWGRVDLIDVDDDGTSCAYTELRRIEPALPLSTLRLRSRGRPMSDDNIRPYAICHTPSFVR